MKKCDELSNPKSCLSKARNDERIFVLLERDEAAPAAVEAWATERVRIGKSREDDQEITEAKNWAHEVRRDNPRLGRNRSGNAILCRASGETDSPSAAIVRTSSEIRSFFIHEWLGGEGSELDDAMARLEEHDWENGLLDWELEMGSVTLEDVYLP